MKATPITAALLVLVTAAAATAVVVKPAAADVPLTAAIAQDAARVPAQPLVTGLPDFTRLVEEVGPGVVNVEVTIGPRGGGQRRQAQQQVPDDAIPEIFRRFFGPGFPFPGGEGGPAPEMPRGRSMGTGFVISGDGYVLTNHHVIDNASDITVRMHDRREFKAELVGSDEQSDVALLKIDATGLAALRIGDSAKVKAGQWAVAIGSPFGLEQSVTAGIVSAVGRSNPYAGQQYVPFIQTDVAINRGNSGGPLLNTSGEVIGINSQIFSNSGGFMGVSFAIPIDMAMNVADQIKATGKVQRGQVGVMFQAQPITSEEARGFGLPDTLGAVVTEVVPGSPAEKAGIEPGDVIRQVDGTRIVQPTDLPPLVGNKAPGTEVTLMVFRDGRERNFKLRLAELDQDLAMGRQPATPRGSQAPQPSDADNALGMAVQDLTAAQRRQLGLDAGEGVRIARVEGVAARQAGLQPGDVVLRVGRTPVGSADEFSRQLRGVKAGQTVMLLVQRDGASRFVAITPGQDDDD